MEAADQKMLDKRFEGVAAQLNAQQKQIDAIDERTAKLVDGVNELRAIYEKRRGPVSD